MKKCFLGVVFILVLSLLGLNPKSSYGSIAQKTATVMSMPGQDVEITMADGLKIQGSFYPNIGSTKAPAALLLHQLGDKRNEWAVFSNPLAENSYKVLGVDMR